MSRTTKVHIALFIVSLIYGATFTVAREVMLPGYVKPFAFIMLRIWVAAILLFVFHSAFIKTAVRDKADYRKLVVCAIFGVVTNMLLFFKGLSLTVPINGAVLMMNTPIFVVVFAAIMLKEKLGIRKVGGIMLAALGAILLMSGGNFSFNSQTALGDLMITANAIVYAFYLVYSKPLTQKYHPLTITLYCFAIGAVLVIPFGFSEFTEIAWSAMPPKILGYIAFVTVGSTFLTYVLNSYALRYASPSLVGSYIYLQPVIASLIAVVSGKDELTSLKMLFIFTIFAGVYLVSKKSNPEPVGDSQ